MGDVTPEQGRAIVAAAAAWQSTPYSSIGPGSEQGKGGDCSGSTWRIYQVAGLPYPYQQTASFADYVARSHRFRELASGEARQEGDVLYWPNHMAIATRFAVDRDHATTDRVNGRGTKWVQTNDM